MKNQNLNNSGQKRGFLLYFDMYPSIAGLCLKDKGILLDAIFKYAINGENPKLNPVLMMAFSFIKTSLDRDNLRYENIVKRNQSNGKLGGRPKKPKKPSGLLENPKNPVGDDIDIDKDIKKENTKKEKLSTEHEQKLLEAFNQTFGSKIKTLKPYETNIKHWLSIYEVEDMVTAIRHIPRHEFWKDKMTPAIFFRQKRPPTKPRGLHKRPVKR